MQLKPIARKIKVLFVFLGLISSLVVAGQNKITGKITGSEDQLPIAGASIQIKGTNIGAISDIDGNFSLTAKSRDVIVISYAGFQTKEVSIGNKTSIDIILSPSNN